MAIPVRAGFTIDRDFCRPHSAERFRAILCVFPSYEDQVRSMKPKSVCPELISTEGPDCDFHARHGDAQVFVQALTDAVYDFVVC